MVPVDHEPEFDHSLVPVDHDPFSPSFSDNSVTPLTNRVPIDLNRYPGEMRAAQFTPTQRIGNAVADGLMALGMQPYTANDLTSRIGNVLNLTPVGIAGNALDTVDAQMRGDHAGAILGMAGMIPGAGPVERELAPAIREGVAEASNALKQAMPTLESRSVSLYNPPVTPLRPFEADYPKGAATDAAGRFTTDIEGRPLGAKYIAGKSSMPDGNVGGAMGGNDQAVPPAELNAISTGLFGQDVAAVPSSLLPGKAVGAFTYARGANGPERIAKILNTLAPEDAERVSAHEIAHGIDNLAGEIPSDRVTNQLRRVYNDLNTPPGDPRIRQQQRTGIPVPNRYQVTPEVFGYKGSDVSREHWAEAIRAYMTDPNYIKSVAPDVAARIRQYVNSNPRINKTIQFNSLVGLGAGLGAAALIPADRDPSVD